MPTDIYGVDFSGSRTPGRDIWIAEAQLRDTEPRMVEIDDVWPVAERFESSHRTGILEELREFIRDRDDAVFGLDFPFGFPEQSVDESEWVAFLNQFAETFEGEDIDAFPGVYASDGRPKRDIDYRYGGQSPMSPQVQYQVFYGLRDLLHPLVDQNDVRVVPMQPRNSSKPTLLEVYPAATLGTEGLYRTGYKGTGTEERDRRQANTEGFKAKKTVSFGGEVADEATRSDDALDSLCAAVAVGRALAGGVEREPQETSVEGHIFA